MFGVATDGKYVAANKDFAIRIPYGAAYDVFDVSGDDLNVLSIYRFEEMPVDYTDGAFQPRGGAGKCDVLNFSLTHALSVDSLGQMNFRDFLGNLKRSTDEELAKVAVGSAGSVDPNGPKYSVLKVVQDTPEIKTGYITSDLFVAANFMAFIFTKKHAYRARLKVVRQPQKFKRTEMYMMSLLSSVRPSTG